MAFCSPNGDEQSLCTGRKYEGNGGGYISEDESAQSEADSEPGEPENGWESGESSPELDEEQPKRRRTGSVSNYANRTPEVSEKISLKKSFYGSAPTKPVKHSTPRSSVPKTTLATSVGRTPTCQKSLSTHPKVLNMGIGSAPGDQSSSLSSVLGNITNMLGSVIERLDKTESKLESMERKLNSPSSSSAGSGAERKRSVPPVVRVSVIIHVSL